MKKIIIFILVASMVWLSACSTDKTVDETPKEIATSSTEKEEVVVATEEKEEEDDSIVTAPGTLPVVKPGVDVTLDIFTTTRPNVEDMEDHPFTKLIEEQTGVKLDFTVAQESEAKKKLNLVLASGSYPDVIMGFSTAFSLAEQTLYAEQGVILPLNDYIEKYGYGWKMMTDLYPQVEDQFRLTDGNIYTLPEINHCFHCSLAVKMWIYKPWLEALGLQEPTTTDEFYNVLKAFKTEDPNGNGEQDEIPLAGSTDGWNSDPKLFLMNSFIYTDATKSYLYLEDGKITAAFDKPEWKKGIEYMRKLAEEDLLATETYTQKTAQLKQLAMEGKVGVVAGAYPGVFGDYTDPEGDWLNYEVMAPLEGPDGVQHAWYNPYFGRAKVFITSACEYPEVAFRLFDTFYINDGSNPISMAEYWYGEEGVAWRKAEEGEIGVDGEQAKWVNLTGKPQPDGETTWNQLENRVLTTELRVKWATQPTDSPMERILFLGSKKMEPYQQKTENILPHLPFSAEQAAEVGELGTALKTLINETFTRLVLTNADLDSEWDAYINELNKLDLDRYLEIYQEAYDAWKK